jgi:DNA repair protein RecO (recombination protein O)
LRGCAAAFIEDPLRLAALAAACAIAEASLPEREPAPQCYVGLDRLLGALAADRGWARSYVRWELDLLGELGFGLDLTRCAATGSTEDLVFVSPKSAQAVSRGAGGPYREKLLKLPAFLRDEAAEASLADIGDGLTLTGFFLERHVVAPLGHKMPAARQRFVDRIGLAKTISGAALSPIHD